MSLGLWPTAIFSLMLVGWGLLLIFNLEPDEKYKGLWKAVKVTMILLGIYSLIVWGWIGLWFYGMFFHFRGF